MESQVYSKNYLTRVRLTIEFPQILNLNETNPPSQFQNDIMQEFPYLNIKKEQDCR
ncbi:MAG: hypothetical protein LBT10_08000 [Methanobrevibacter sp.]|jgi:hypothetical protein|nr:hypothetical protein [Methanobrevibacter sp.]